MRPLLLTVLLLAGCSGPVRTVAIDYAATDAQRWALSDRISYWNTALSEGHRLRHADGPDVDVFVDIGDPLNGRDGAFRNGRIILRPDLDDERFLRDLGHELGHAIGLEHTSCGVMEGTLGVVPGATFCDADLNECRDQGACP